MPSGVFVLALSARIRSHGLPTPRRKRVEDTSAGDLEVREAGAVEKLGSRKRSAVGILSASGS